MWVMQQVVEVLALGCDMECSLIPLRGVMGILHPLLSKMGFFLCSWVFRFTLCWKKSNWLQTLTGQVSTNSKKHWSRVWMHIYHLLTCRENNMWKCKLLCVLKQWNLKWLSCSMACKHPQPANATTSYSRLPLFTTVGAHSCSWVCQEADMWASWLGGGQRALLMDLSTKFLRSKVTAE